MEYIIETSGTTGSAKRVLYTEAALMRQAETDVAELGIDSKDVINVDRWGMSGLRKVYIGRVSGAKVAFYPGHERQSMREWVIAEGITYLSVLASTFRWLSGGVYKFPLVKILEIGGEMVDWDDCRIARERFPNAVLVNRYGTSETNLICRKIVRREDALGKGRMPVGRPIKGVDLWAGPSESEPEEIRVCSPYMAEGYYNDRELTAAKFRDGWLYHTGDLGYWLPNGELMHCGRKDFAGEVRDKFDAERYLHERNMASAMMGGEVK